MVGMVPKDVSRFAVMQIGQMVPNHSTVPTCQGMVFLKREHVFDKRRADRKPGSGCDFSSGICGCAVQTTGVDCRQHNGAAHPGEVK